MKKYLFSISLIFGLLIFGIVYADNTSTNKINELKQKVIDLKQKASEDRAKIKTEIASTTTNIKDVRQELKSAAEIRIGKKLNEQKTKIADAFEKAIRNEKDLIIRIESRISKMESQSIDLSSSKKFLEVAKNKIDIADSELTNLENLLAQNIPAATSTLASARKTLLQNIKTQSDKTKAAIKTAHASIIDVVSSLKLGLLKNGATSTNETVSTSTNN